MWKIDALEDIVEDATKYIVVQVHPTCLLQYTNISNDTLRAQVAIGYGIIPPCSLPFLFLSSSSPAFLPFPSLLYLFTPPWCP